VVRAAHYPVVLVGVRLFAPVFHNRSGFEAKNFHALPKRFPGLRFPHPDEGPRLRVPGRWNFAVLEGEFRGDLVLENLLRLHPHLVLVENAANEVGLVAMVLRVLNHLGNLILEDACLAKPVVARAKNEGEFRHLLFLPRDVPLVKPVHYQRTLGTRPVGAGVPEKREHQDPKFFDGHNPLKEFLEVVRLSVLRFLEHRGGGRGEK